MRSDETSATPSRYELLLGLLRRRRRRWFGWRVRWRHGEELANERKLGLRAPVGLVEAERPIVFHAGKTGVDVAQVLVRDRIIGACRERQLERPLRFLVLALTGPDHGEVVIRFRQLGIILDET